MEYYLIENIFSPSEEGEKNSSDSAASIYVFRGVSEHNNKVQRENTSFFGSYSALVDWLSKLAEEEGTSSVKI